MLKRKATRNALAWTDIFVQRLRELGGSARSISGSSLKAR
jgi:hypothetical protein